MSRKEGKLTTWHTSSGGPDFKNLFGSVQAGAFILAQSKPLLRTKVLKHLCSLFFVDFHQGHFRLGTRQKAHTSLFASLDINKAFLGCQASY